MKVPIEKTLENVKMNSFHTIMRFFFGAWSHVGSARRSAPRRKWFPGTNSEKSMPWYICSTDNPLYIYYFRDGFLVHNSAKSMP